MISLLHCIHSYVVAQNSPTSWVQSGCEPSGACHLFQSGKINHQYLADYHFVQFFWNIKNEPMNPARHPKQVVLPHLWFLFFFRVVQQETWRRCIPRSTVVAVIFVFILNDGFRDRITFFRPSTSFYFSSPVPVAGANFMKFFHFNLKKASGGPAPSVYSRENFIGSTKLYRTVRKVWSSPIYFFKKYTCLVLVGKIDAPTAQDPLPCLSKPRTGWVFREPNFQRKVLEYRTCDYMENWFAWCFGVIIASFRNRRHGRKYQGQGGYQNTPARRSSWSAPHQLLDETWSSFWEYHAGKMSCCYRIFNQPNSTLLMCHQAFP